MIQLFYLMPILFNKGIWWDNKLFFSIISVQNTHVHLKKKKMELLFTHQGFLVNPVFHCASSRTLTLKPQHANLSEEDTVITAHV